MSAGILAPRRAPATQNAGGRSTALDAFRGLAVLVMLLDHLCLVFDGPVFLRESVGRFAVPMFFLLAGHLAGRPRLRHFYVACLGVWLGFLVPWVDSPNVLTLWALGVVLLHVLDRLGVAPWLVAVAGLTFLANGYGIGGAGFYDPLALWGLMGLGAVLSRGVFAWAEVLPGWVAGIGRHPVAWYAGHLVVLQLVVMVGGL